MDVCGQDEALNPHCRLNVDINIIREVLITLLLFTRDNGKDSMLCHRTRDRGRGEGEEGRRGVTSHHTAQEGWGVGNIEVSTDGWVGRGKGLEGLTCTLILACTAASWWLAHLYL